MNDFDGEKKGAVTRDFQRHTYQVEKKAFPSETAIFHPPKNARLKRTAGLRIKSVVPLKDRAFPCIILLVFIFPTTRLCQGALFIFVAQGLAALLHPSIRTITILSFRFFFLFPSAFSDWSGLYDEAPLYARASMGRCIMRASLAA